jgi:hypothetical protein
MIQAAFVHNIELAERPGATRDILQLESLEIAE